MSDIYQGDQIHHGEVVVDTAGSPVTGLSWTFPIAWDPDGLTFVPSVVDLGGGFYDFTWTANKIGTYAIEMVTVGVPTGEQRFGAFIDVDPPPSVVAVPTIATTDQATGWTLRELREAIAQKFRDILTLEATGGGSVSGLVDQLNLVENTDYFRGADMLVISGHPDNIGQVRRVVGSSAEGLSISWVPELPQPIQVGDQVQLYNHGIVSVRLQEYRNAINQALTAAFPANRVPISAVLVDAYDDTLGTVPIPDAFVFLHSVEYLDSLGFWQPIYAAKDEGYEGWSVRRDSGLVTIRGRYGRSADGKLIRLSGYARPAKLVNDDDRTTTDFEWVVEYASGLLTVGQMSQQTYPIGQNLINRSDQLRAKMTHIPEPDTRRVRS